MSTANTPAPIPPATPTLTPTPTPTPPSSSIPPSANAKANADANTYARLKNTTSISLLLACPLLMLLPPRKLDLYTFSLGGAWLWSANALSRERSGRSILERVDAWRPRDLPGRRAEEVRERLRTERGVRGGGEGDGGEGGKGKEKGLVGRLWMGGEEEGWKERRDREEREALEEGRGYGGLILDQIWEVWSWGEGKGKGEGREGGGRGERGGREGEEGKGK